MKILLTCDPEIPVPPKEYGGVERLVDGLAKAYSMAGHEVYLLAHQDSNSFFPKQIFSWPSVNSRGSMNIIKNAQKLRKVHKKIKPDVIHSFSRLLYTYPVLFTSKTPFLQTYGRAISRYSTFLAALLGGSKMNFTACGKHMITHIQHRARLSVIPNFLPNDFFVPIPNPKADYLFFLGRIEDVKGTYEAIEVAKKTGYKLIIAGNIAKEHRNYFNTKIKPNLKSGEIEYVGTVDDDSKLPLLQNAKALLFPIKWEEPFGIVMIESLSCSTAVIAFRRGAVEEVIDHGITGFIVDNVDQMAEAVNKVHLLSRKTIRETTVARFSTKVVSDMYLDILNKLILQNK